MTKPLFKPKRSRNESTRKSIVNRMLKSSHSLIELTKNSHYCVSQLPALPSFLNHSSALNGYSDHKSNYAVVASETGVFVWPYQSTDSSPLVIEFPFDTVSIQGTPILPLAILTSPSNTNPKDPGIVIINGSTGHLSFYESVQHSPALGLIGNKNFEMNIPINSDKQEFILFAENVEPSGIIVVTSWKRVILVSLRDFHNKPRLACLELMKPINNVLKLFNLGTSSVNTDIVCIRTGNLYNNGAKQEIIVQESSGITHIFTLDLSCINGVPQLDDSMTFKHSLNPYIEMNIDGFQLSTSKIEYLDIYQLKSVDIDHAFLILCSVTTDETTNLVLVTAKIDSSGVLVYGSHLCTSFSGTAISEPKLFIPEPETTVFIVVDNQVILTDLDFSYFSTQGTISFYKSRWEDSIRLKNHIEILGMGYENSSTTSNPSIILLTSNSGVLRIERFFNDNTESSDSTHLVKSHIEQAIFYSGSSAIDFNSIQQYDQEIVSQVIQDIITEIMNSKSPYLSNDPSAIKATLSRKSQLLKTLIDYCKDAVTEAVTLKIVYALEKIDFASYFYDSLDVEDSFSKQSKTILTNILNEKFPGLSYDMIRGFFIEKLDDINSIFTELITKLIELDVSSSRLMDLITKLFYDAILLNEIKYLDQIPVKKSWMFDTDLFFQIESYFQTRYVDDSSFMYPSDIREKIVKLCNVFYYFINQAINYMKVEFNAELNTYISWYKQNKLKWVQCLISNNLNEQAISLVETYEDFQSLCEVLEDDRQKLIGYGTDSIEYNALIAKYYGYFEKYGYDFGEQLFDYYIDHEQIQVLLTNFGRYKDFINQYFDNNIDKVSNVSWISYLLDNQFQKVSNSLIKSAELHKNEFLNNQELKFSLAKLSTIAAKDSSSMSTDDIDDNLFQIETKLILIRIQRSCYQYVIEGLPKGTGNEELKLELFANNFLNNRIDKSTLLGIFKPLFSCFISNQSLPETTLIDYLTFIKPTSKFSNGFSNAFKIACLLPDESSYKLHIKKIWCRLLVITDDWKDLVSTEQRTDEFVRRTMRNSVFYKTISSFNDTKEVEILKEILQDTESVYDEDNVLLAELNKSYFKQALDVIGRYNILERIDSSEFNVKR